MWRTLGAQIEVDAAFGTQASALATFLVLVVDHFFTAVAHKIVHEGSFVVEEVLANASFDIA